MKIFLLSYPRSGNSWIRYFVEFISERPTLGCSSNPDDVPLCTNSLEDNPLLNVDLTAEPVLFKSHGEGLESPAQNKLLFITRSPAIVIKRNCGYFSRKGIYDYYKLLSVFDRWEGQKLYIKYEELMLSPKENLQKICTFLDAKQELMDSFLANYENHKKISIRLYSDVKSGIPPKGKSKTKGKITNPPKTSAFIFKLVLLLFGKYYYKKYYYE